jgi:hypothetical protein
MLQIFWFVAKHWVFVLFLFCQFRMEQRKIAQWHSWWRGKRHRKASVSSQVDKWIKAAETLNNIYVIQRHTVRTEWVSCNPLLNFSDGVPNSHACLLTEMFTLFPTLNDACTRKGYKFSTLLGAFGKLLTSSFFLSVSLSPSIRMEQLFSHWMDFHDFWCIFRKYLEKMCLIKIRQE